MTDISLPEACLRRLDRLLATGGRRILGIAGPPGSGKSTLADAVAAKYPEQSVVVPMDGFHFANIELARLGRAARKGAPDTFDSAGFVALLRRLRAPAIGEIVYAPLFLRDIEEAIASAVPVAPEVPLVIVEGNYLLMRDGFWGEVRPLLDEAWFVEVDPTLRRRRLVDRHIRFGRSPADAEAWVLSTDDPNALVIEAGKSAADLVVTL